MNIQELLTSAAVTDKLVGRNRISADLTGIVTDVRFTSGGDGRQRTFIDGYEFATWWDVRDRDWHVGDKVTFTASYGPLWANSTSYTWKATNIRKA